MVTLSGCHLLRDRLFAIFVSAPDEALTIELVEVHAVGLVGDQEIEYRPDEGEAAVLAGEAAYHLSAAFDLAQ